MLLVASPKPTLPKPTFFSLIGILLVSSLAVLMSACNSLPNATKDNPAADTSIPDAIKQPSNAERNIVRQPTFPQYENETAGISASLLYDLLVSSLAFQSGEIDLASSTLLHAAKDSQDPIILSRAVRMAIHNKSYQTASSIGQRWITLAPDDHQAAIITALALVLANDEEGAFSVLKTLLAQSPDKLGQRFRQIGEVFLQHAKDVPTQTLFTQLIELHPAVAQGWLVLAGIAQRHKALPLMHRALDKILAIEPDNQQAASYKLAGLGEDENKQFSFARTFLKQNPKAHDLRMQFARILLRKNYDDEALKQVLTALKHQTKNVDALHLAALLYQAASDYKNAVKYFAQQLKEAPDDDRNRLYFANALQQLERYDEAKIQLALIQSKAEYFNAQRQMLSLIEKADGSKAALLYLENIQASNQTETIQLLTDKELILRRAERLDEALTLLTDGLAQYPDDTTLRYHRALLVLDMDDLITHESDMRILLAKEPDNAQYYNSLGYTLLTLTGRLEEAGRLINKAHELKPKDPYILDSKGWLSYKQGDYLGALAFLKLAFELDQDAEIAAHLGEVYWQKGDETLAREFWKKGDEIDKDNKALQATKKRFLK